MRSSAVLGAPDGAETNSGSVKAAPLSGQVALHSGDNLPRTAAPDAFTDAVRASLAQFQTSLALTGVSDRSHAGCAKRKCSMVTLLSEGCRV